MSHYRRTSKYDFFENWLLCSVTLRPLSRGSFYLSSNIAGKNQTKHITWFLHLFRISDPSNILATWWLQPNKSRKTSDLRLPVFNRNHQAIRIRLRLRLDGMKHFLLMLVKLLFVFRKGFLPYGCKQWLLQTSVNKGSVHLVCQGGWNFDNYKRCGVANVQHATEVQKKMVICQQHFELILAWQDSVFCYPQEN